MILSDSHSRCCLHSYDAISWRLQYDEVEEMPTVSPFGYRMLAQGVAVFHDLRLSAQSSINPVIGLILIAFRPGVSLGFVTTIGKLWRRAKPAQGQRRRLDTTDVAASSDGGVRSPSIAEYRRDSARSAMRGGNWVLWNWDWAWKKVGVCGWCGDAMRERWKANHQLIKYSPDDEMSTRNDR